MDVYSERFNLTVSSTVADIAAMVGKGFDPDVGGENSFHDNGNGTLSTSAPCAAEFRQQAEYLMADSAALHQALSAQFETRWPDLTAPTLEQCQSFINNIITGQ